MAINGRTRVSSTVPPYVDDERNRMAYSLRARTMHAPTTATGAGSGAKVAGKQAGAEDKAA